MTWTVDYSHTRFVVVCAYLLFLLDRVFLITDNLIHSGGHFGRLFEREVWAVF